MGYFEHAVNEEEGGKLPVLLLEGDVNKGGWHMGVS
jgi:hypothetical protein